MKLLISLLLICVMFSSCQKAPAGHEYPWKPYSPRAVAASVAQHKPVIIDFWAEWCPSCHDLDRIVFSRPDIQAKLAQMTTLRMDVTNQDDPNVQKIVEQYALEGVPTVVFLNAKGQEVQDARIIGLATPQDFFQAFAMLKVLK